MKVWSKTKKSVRNFFHSLGPGFIAGAADDDPTGIAVYTQAGAKFGYNQLWTALFMWPFMVTIQEMCGRIGLVTGRGLTGIIKRRYSRSVLVLAVSSLLLTNIVCIGADLGSMAAAAQLIYNLPFLFWLLLFSVIILLLEIWLSYKVYASYLKYLTLFLFAYIAVAIIVKPDWHEIAISTIVPTFSLSKDFLLSLVAILGTNISPYLFFWQTNEEVEEEVASGQVRIMGQGQPKIKPQDVKHMRTDTGIGMFFSNFIVFFIAIAAAATLGRQGLSAGDNPAEAAQALVPLAGPFAAWLFAFGLIGSGLLAVPVYSGSAAYALAETFRWKEGLYRRFKQAKPFYLIIILSTLIGLLTNFLSIPPFKMLVYASVLNGIVSPILMVIILLIANDEKIMGQYKNTFWSNFFGWLITILIFLASVIFLLSLV